ncbi:MAG: Triosephosphate isomerase [Chlamydiia bacterium]|nr:Triosephosphate isomerase [Chlamydiia bacterium]
MNKTISEAIDFMDTIRQEMGKTTRGVALCVPFTAISTVSVMAKEMNMPIGAQNISEHDHGAYTGEVSAEMCRDAGADFTLIGHSERRKYFGETSELTCVKIGRAINHNLAPILCVGESLEDRENNQSERVIAEQLEEGLKGFEAGELGRLIIAYEPVWAIGTGKVASVEVIEEMHHFIRDLLSARFSAEFAKATRILYGGSVKPSNIASIIALEDVDGALVGGASLEAKSLVQLTLTVGTTR